jgi:hypothetical protein
MKENPISTKREVSLNVNIKKCVFDLGTYAHNPLKEWLQACKEEGYPQFKFEKKRVTLDWGMEEKFNCNTSMYNITSMQLKVHHKATYMESQTRVRKLIPTTFEFLQNKNVIDLRCLP